MKKLKHTDITVTYKASGTFLKGEKRTPVLHSAMREFLKAFEDEPLHDLIATEEDPFVANNGVLVWYETDVNHVIVDDE